MMKRALIGLFIFAAVGFAEVQDEARRAQMLAIAKRGQVDEVWEVLDELFFRANALRAADPALAWEVYQTAKDAGMPDRHWAFDELVETLELAQDAPPFNVEQFLETYGVSDEDGEWPPYDVWELAEEASVGGRFGTPDPGLVFNLVIRGSWVPFELATAIKTVHADYMAGRVRPFRLGDYASSGAGGSYVAWREDQRAKAGRHVQLEQLAQSCPAVELAEVQTLYDVACVYFEATAGAEEGHGGSGYEGWVISSVRLMKQAFFKELSGFVRDDVPELVIGASDVDVALQFEQLFTRPDVQAFLKSFDWVEPSEVLHAQEVWGTYRDQFVQFMKKARSNVDESVWKNWLNRQRIERLKGFEKTIGWMG